MADFIMDFPYVEGMSKGFADAANVLNTIQTALQGAIQILETAACIGVIGAAAAACYLRGIEPRLKRLAESCQELSADLDGAVKSVRDANDAGSLRFASKEGS